MNEVKKLRIEKYIPIEANGKLYNVWTESVGNNESIKILLLHGGPGSCHHVFAQMEDLFEEEEGQYIYYDQLGSCMSDHPEDESLWFIERFVDEVEEVRKSWKLDSSNFYLFGGSWGAMLALEYALKYGNHLKGLIVSNMSASIKDDVMYCKEVLLPKMGATFQRRILQLIDEDKTDTSEYAIMMDRFNEEFFLRASKQGIPKLVQTFYDHYNPAVSNTMLLEKGFTVSGTASNWSVKERLHQLKVPTLVIGASHDMANPDDLKRMSEEIQNGQFHLCPDSGHMAPFDNPESYFGAIKKFLKETDSQS